MSTDVPPLGSLLAGLPSNWGRWGPDDEIGALNHLDADQVLRGVASVRSGRTFTLQVPIGHPHGDPVFPGMRGPAQRANVMDRGHYLRGEGDESPGGLEYADDVITMYLQGTTHYDALGHAWCDDVLYNGYPASTTVGSLARASVLPIAEHGIVGRGVLLDVARHRGRTALEKGETVGLADLLATAASQGVTIEPRDVLLVRTGFLGYFYAVPAAEFYADLVEPGLAFSAELCHWFQDLEIPSLVTDTLANEVTEDPATGVALPLHIALMRNLGVAFAEVVALDELAADCEDDGQYTFLYAAAPLKVVGATGSPVNPLVIK